MSEIKKNKGGRPRVQIDETELGKLASIGCTMKEMAAFFDCSVDTLELRFADVIAKGREKGKSSVRRMMWLHGEKGNSTALRYLIYNVLKERIDDPQNTQQSEVVLTPEQEKTRQDYLEFLRSRK